MNKVSEAVLAYINAQVGKAQYSRTKRMAEGFYDCASIVYRAYKAAGVNLTVEHSTSMYEVYAKEFRLLWPARYEDIGKKFAPKDILQQLGVSGGEHVFYCTDLSTTRFNKITHVSTVRAGGKQIVHARNTTVDVCVDDASYSNTRICAVVEYVGKDTTPVISRVLKRTLPKNMTGEDVRIVQQKLLDLGFEVKGGADGKFGKNTRDAVIAFQKSRGIKVDGKVGPQTTAWLSFAWKG